ncbi:uncharacterized protein A4U43_C09F4090 [Asparagus officinalis]|uniref:Uncharacterized protein n=1 Tax=Asparagus officinalis TaxID=4686 RepID=A0A5P1E8I6_ASPOF|nr:uncharacterized protein A4U43_C09F4090 [Asparagus officinalis]
MASPSCDCRRNFIGRARPQGVLIPRPTPHSMIMPLGAASAMQTSESDEMISRQAPADEEEVQDQVQRRAEGEDAGVRREGRVEAAEAGGGRGAAVLPGDRGQEEGAQGLDAQQQAQFGEEGAAG